MQSAQTRLPAFVTTWLLHNLNGACDGKQNFTITNLRCTNLSQQWISRHYFAKNKNTIYAIIKKRQYGKHIYLRCWPPHKKIRNWNFLGSQIPRPLFWKKTRRGVLIFFPKFTHLPPYQKNWNSSMTWVFFFDKWKICTSSFGHAGVILRLRALARSIWSCAMENQGPCYRCKNRI